MSARQVLTVERVIPTFLLSLEAEDRARATRRTYETALRGFARHVGACSLAELGPESADGFLVALRRSGAKSATLSTYYAALKAFARFLVSRELVDADPFRGARAPKHRPQPKDGFSEDELAALLAATSPRTEAGARNRAILITLFATGLRVAELCQLRRADLEGSQRQQLIRVVGKGNKERRIVLAPLAREAIAHYLLLRGDDDEPALFRARSGGPLHPDGVQALVSRIAARAGVVGAHPHRFRNTALAAMLAAGMSEAEVMRIAGHSRLAMLQHYVAYQEQVRANDSLLAADHVGKYLPLPARKRATKS